MESIDLEEFQESFEEFIDEFEYSLEAADIYKSQADQRPLEWNEMARKHAKALNDTLVRASIYGKEYDALSGKPISPEDQPILSLRHTEFGKKKSEQANRELLEGYKKGYYTRSDLQNRQYHHLIYRADHHRALAEMHARLAHEAQTAEKAKKHADMAAKHADLYTKLRLRKATGHGVIHPWTWKTKMLDSIRHLR